MPPIDPRLRHEQSLHRRATAGGLVVGATVLGALYLWSYKIATTNDMWLGFQMSLAVVQLVVWPVAFLFFRPFRRFKDSLTATQGRLSDARVPVLLLRSYSRSRFADVPGFGRSTEVADFAPKDPLGVLRSAAASIERQIGPTVTVEVPERYDSGSHYQLPALDESWRVVMLLSAFASRAIVILPDHSPGLEQEVMWLAPRVNLVVIMPPGPEGRVVYTRAWSVIRERWRRVGFVLPEYQVGGCVYLADRALSPIRRIDLHGQLDAIGGSVAALTGHRPEGFPLGALASFAGSLTFDPKNEFPLPSAELRLAGETLLRPLDLAILRTFESECQRIGRLMPGHAHLSYWCQTIGAEIERRGH